MSRDKVLFVFYSFVDGMEGTSWHYDKFPKGWEWTGSGSTIPFGSDREKHIRNNLSVLDFSREEQFNGPTETLNSMKEYLNKFFKQLKIDGIIKNYKIKKSYKP